MEEQKKKILLVEDDPNFGTILKDYLGMNNYDVVHAKNGMEGFEKFKKDDYDLCILDVMMPKIEDGIQTYKQFRTDEKLGAIPIIMLSAIAKKTFFHSIWMLNPERGGRVPEPDAYMEKPPDANELSRLIADLLTTETE